MPIENFQVRSGPQIIGIDFEDQPIKEQERHPLDTEPMRKLHRKLIDWYYFEKEKQAINRYHQSLDQDFYDNLQWATEDAEEVVARGQQPLVFNEIAPMVDWMIGTERRTKVDWNILPREEGDVIIAGVKKKVLKYLSDVNSIPFKRSRAFNDAVKVGVGWMEDGVSPDPSREIVFSKYVDWRSMLWDSTNYELDLGDCRYLYRWKYVDTDLAEGQFPDRKAVIRRASEKYGIYTEEDDEFWYLGQHFEAKDTSGNTIGRRIYASDAFMVGTKRHRVRLIECWYRMPAKVKVCFGAFDGELFDPNNQMMLRAAETGELEVIDQIRMQMFVAVMTENEFISHQPSPYKHNQFPYTPIWCYIRGRDRMPYGVIRRVRDIQEDLNKRASKSLFILSTNQILAEEGAVEDWEEVREEADRPDGTMVVKANKRFDLIKGIDVSKAHLEWMDFDATKIQNTTGINRENLGRQTNAISGEAIKARQLQGSVSSTEPFDNLRYATQTQGAKVLSLAEQFISAPKVYRLTEAQGIQWIKVNQPEVMNDGSVRWINDLTASQADFIVSEQDYQASLRDAMFEAMMEVAARLQVDPKLTLKIMRIAFGYSNLPNKHEIVNELRMMLGEPDPDKVPTEEELKAAEAQKQMEEQALAMQQQAAQLELEKQNAEVQNLNAKTSEIMAKIDEIQNGDLTKDFETKLRAIQEAASRQIEMLSQKMVKLQGDLQRHLADIRNSSDKAVETAKIKGEYDLKIAEMNNAGKAAIAEFNKEIDLVKANIDSMKLEDDTSKTKALEEIKDQIDELKDTIGEIDIKTQPKPEVVDTGPKTKEIEITRPDGKTYVGKIVETDDKKTVTISAKNA